MDKIIIGIHGLANKEPKSVLADWWKRSILEGLRENCKIKNMNLNFEMVHWADLLYKYPLHRDKKYTFDKLYNNEPYKPASKGVLKEYKENFLDRAREIAQSKLGWVADKTRGYLGLDAIGDFLLQRVLKDLYFYYDPKQILFDHNEKKGRARDILQRKLESVLIAKKENNILLIAHSMGSIIAYDVLRNLGRKNVGVKVPYFATIGSPLGLPHVKFKIHKERTYDRRVRTPSIVTKKWANFADRMDPVAIDTHLHDDYGANDRNIRVKDDLVSNDYKARGENNHHKSYGYLRTPEFSSFIKEFLGLP